MKTQLYDFIKTFQAEQIKKKGSGLYWTAVIMGAFLSLMGFAITIAVKKIGENADFSPDNLYSYYINQNLGSFAGFFLPLLIIITASRIAQFDHKNGGWQLMETQPASKFSIYFSKFAILLIVNLIAILSSLFFSVVTTWLTTFIIEIHKETSLDLPITDIIHIIFRLFIAAAFLSAFQYFLAVLLSSFIWGMLIGFFGLILNFILTTMYLAPAWSPFKILSDVSSTESDLGHWLLYTEYLSLLFGIILLYIGFNWYRFKTLPLAIKENKTKLVSISLFLIIPIGLAGWLMIPNQMDDYNKTIICGKIESKFPLQKIMVYDNIIRDTVAIIPIKDNAFHYEFKNDVIPDNYTFVIDGKWNSTFFFGKSDSIYIDGTIREKSNTFKIKGTRLAENKMSQKSRGDYINAQYSLEYEKLDRYDNFIKELYDQWKETMNASDNFKTADNYIAQNDFTERNKKLKTVNYLRCWNELIKKRKALYPNQKTTEDSRIKEMKQKVSLSEEGLLSDENYFDFVKNEMIADNHSETDENTKVLNAILKLKPSSFRDKMLYWQLNNCIEESHNASERNQIVSTYSNQFGNAHFHDKINAVNRMAESLSKGQKAPDFVASSIDGKQYSLANFKGKFVVIDTWATWCGPCRYQSEFFEKLAIKYKKENIQFVALSLDERVDKWFVEAKTKPATVLQLHANNTKLLSDNYNVVGIPRFILIDPNGNFANSQMPTPEEESFEIVLRKAMNLTDNL